MLSGGGARGAYEVGVVAGLVEILGRAPSDPAPFEIFAGTSVGAINVTWLAAHVDRSDMLVERLAEIWSTLDLGRALRVNPAGLFGLRERLGLFGRLLGQGPPPQGAHLGRSLIDPETVERLVTELVPWSRLHDNTRQGRLRALIVTALNVGTGRTNMFAELAPGQTFRPSRDPRRRGRCQPITADHVLASAAIPLVFPARRVGNAYFADGGLRFNTPMSPAIRSGARRICVVSLRHKKTPAELDAGDEVDHTLDYPDVFFLLGKLLNALLLDSIEYDLQVLERFNRLLTVLDESLTAEEMARVQSVLIDHRGTHYHRVHPLVFVPSQDIGVLAGRYLAERLDHLDLPWHTRWLLRRAASAEGSEADLASYVLFDGEYARRLIDLGRADAWAKEDEVRAFFSPDAAD